MSRRSTRWCSAVVAAIVAGSMAFALGAGAGEGTDPQGDTKNDDTQEPMDVPEADIVRNWISVESRAIMLGLQVRKPTDPAKHRAWMDGDSSAEWDLDVNGDAKPDFTAALSNEDGKLTGGVSRFDETEPDPIGGFLGARLDHVRALCGTDDRYVWLNQYTNPGNWLAHYRTTAPAIVRQFPELDVLFVGAGTTGTLMGCARFMREWHRPVQVVAVDSVGSVTFGSPAGRRMIPGLGMGVRPPLLDESYVDEVVLVEEPDTIRTCHRLARRGFLFGGSTGTVVSGAISWLAEHEGEELTTVAIAPDLGERYLDTIYHANWVQGLYGRDVLEVDVRTPLERSAARAPTQRFTANWA